MKNILFISLFIATLFSSCHKSNDVINHSPTFMAMQGTWSIKSITCYQGSPVGLLLQSDSYVKYNSDMTGVSYEGSITNRYSNFTYNLLEDDSTIIFQSITAGVTNLDTSVITRLTSNEFIYHGTSTYVHHGPTPCINGNALDSLYR